MSKKILSVLRESDGLDDYPIINKFKHDKTIEVKNFDDRLYGLSPLKPLYKKIFRRIFLRPYYIRKFNNDLIKTILIDRPDIFIVFKGSLLRERTLKIVRKLEIKSIIIYPDLDPSVYGKAFTKALSYFDFFYFTKPNLVNLFKKINSRAKLIPPFYSHKGIFKPKAINYEIGVSFIGHYSIKKLSLLKRFAKAYPYKVSVFGDNWPVDTFSKLPNNLFFHDSIYGDKVTEIYRTSVCSLGLLQESLSGTSLGDEITSRTTLIPSLGGIIIHENTKSAKNFFLSCNECLFDKIEDAAALAVCLRNDPLMRSKLAEKQRNCVIKNGTNMNEFIDMIIEL